MQGGQGNSAVAGGGGPGARWRAGHPTAGACQGARRPGCGGRGTRADKEFGGQQGWVVRGTPVWDGHVTMSAGGARAVVLRGGKVDQAVSGARAPPGNPVKWRSPWRPRPSGHQTSTKVAPASFYGSPRTVVSSGTREVSLLVS